MYEPTTSIRIVSLIFMEVPIEAAMFYRPYNSNLNGETLQQVVDVTQGGLNISTEVFSPLAGRIIAPSSVPKGTILLPNGWNEKRYSVLIQFEINSPFGATREILTGFTDYAGVSDQGNADPTMNIHLNSHTVARSREVIGANGRQHTYTSEGAMQVLNPVQVQTPDQTTITVDTPMRPSDTVLYQQREARNLNGEDVIDSRTSMLDGYIPSKVDNNIGSRYLSNLCTGYKSSTAANPEVSDDKSFIMGAAANTNQLKESNINASLLFRRLKDATQYGQVASVSMAELTGIWPEATHPDIMHLMKRPETVPVSNAEFNHTWGDASVETGIAYILNQAVPALMSSHLFVNYGFTMTNRIMDSVHPAITTTNANCVIPLNDQVRRIQAIELTIASDIHNQILSRGVIDYAVTMDCSATGSNSIIISVNGGPDIPYSAPAYCDSIYSPVLGDGMETLANLSYDIDHMLTGIFNQEMDPFIGHNNGLY